MVMWFLHLLVRIYELGKPVELGIIVCDEVDLVVEAEAEEDAKDEGIGVGIVVRIPPFGKLVTTLLLLKVMNSGDSFWINCAQFCKSRQAPRPARTIWMVMYVFAGRLADTAPNHMLPPVDTTMSSLVLWAEQVTSGGYWEGCLLGDRAIVRQVPT